MINRKLIAVIIFRLVPLVDVIQIMVAAFPEEVMDRSRKVS